MLSIYIYYVGFQQRAQRLPSPSSSSDSDMGHFLASWHPREADEYEIDTTMEFARSPSYESTDSMPGLGIAGVRSRVSSARQVPSSSFPIEASSSAETVPLSVYLELRRECDDLYVAKSQLQSLIDTYTEDSRALSSDSTARLRALIQTATTQMEQLPPATNVKYGQGRMICQMMIDQIQSVVNHEQSGHDD